MNQIALQDKRLTPATAAEITQHLNLLFASLPIQGGADPAAAVKGYLLALEGRPDWAIERAVRKVLRGEVAGLSTKWCPRPPELSEAVKAECAHVHADIERKASILASRKKADESPRIVHLTPEQMDNRREVATKVMAGFRAAMPPAEKKPDALDDAFWDRANRAGGHGIRRHDDRMQS